MIISRSKRFLFVHIQKTAGRSFEAVLKEHIPDLENFMGTHDHAVWAKERLSRNWNEYYKVAFVRNPWDRLVSWYTMIQERGKPTWYKRFTGKGKYSRMRQYVFENSKTFEDFLFNCVDIIEDTDGRKSFAYNQLDYITDGDGSILVDFIGKFENLNKDTQTVFQNLGLENAALPHKNSSNHKNYRSYYTEETKELVAGRFARDIDFFGYKF